MKICLTIAFALLCTVAAFAQDPPPAAAETVWISGDIAQPYGLAFATNLPHTNVKAKGHDGKEHEYSGFLLSDILNKAGALPENKLTGKALAKYILIKAADGYRAVIAFAEVNSDFNDKNIILADKVDGQKLPANVGPFQVIIPGDKKWGRWVRQVTAIDVKTAKD